MILRSGALLLATLLLAACAHLSPTAITGNVDSAGNDRMIVVVLENPPDPPPLPAGSTPRGYAGAPDYAVGETALRTAQRLATEYRLRAVKAWVIAPLKVYCVVYDLGDPASRAAVLSALGRDPAVKSVQPLQTFNTLGNSSYNDPYLDLQQGFARIDAADAQQASQGEGVKVAVIDTGMDTRHPDLKGRIVLQRNFVDDDADQFVHDRHGTEVAGIIAADANNREGIVGIAPRARLLAFKACWQAGAPGAAQCNSYTLSLALVASMDAGAQIINLSLGGPPDPLLTQLVQLALARGIVVVGAVPPDGRVDGFPVGIAGVIAVDSAGGAARAPAVLHAPGRDVITLFPEGHYDFASGSSLAAAHVAGTAALLLALKPGLRSAELQELLAVSEHGAPAGDGKATDVAVDACLALRGLRPGLLCATAVPQPLAQRILSLPATISPPAGTH